MAKADLKSNSTKYTRRAGLVHGSKLLMGLSLAPFLTESAKAESLTDRIFRFEKPFINLRFIRDFLALNTPLSGTLQYCKVEKRHHYFLIVQAGENSCAFSFVPETVIEAADPDYLKDRTFDESKFKSSRSLVGYIPFLFYSSALIESWKLTDTYIVLEEHTFEQKDIVSIIRKAKEKFSIYNIGFVSGMGSVADCIGFSKHIIGELKKA